MRIRAATAEDNSRLIAIERLTPQGGRIQLASERKDYFFRAKKFESPILFVAEDEDQGHILGIMGVGPVAVRLRGEITRGGFIFDWRSNPLTQKGLPRHMFRLWQAAQAEIAQRNLEFVFGYVKEDNERSLGILTKYGAKVVETKEFLTMPVHASFCRKQAEVNKVVFIRTIDKEEDKAILENNFGTLDLFPELPQSGVLTTQKKRYLFGQFTYGKSAVKVLDTNAEYSQRVLNMPLLYKIVRPLFHVGSKVLSLPHIPKLGDEIRVWQLYDLILDQPGDLYYLLEKVRLAAKDNNVNYLVICMSAEDEGYDQISKRAWVRPRYHLFFLPMTEGLPFPQKPTYFDVSYL